MQRREAIKQVALLLGGTLALPQILRAWEQPTILNLEGRLTAAEKFLLAELVETIIPTTDTPGAKEAGVPDFIEKYVADCLDTQERRAFMDGLEMVNKKSLEMAKSNFAEASDKDRISVLKTVEKASMNNMDTEAGFWKQIKSLTVTGYYTSEIGCTQALRYVAVPGRYDGDMPYAKSDKAWATN